MKKLMIAIAGAVAVGCSAFAGTVNWFNGGIAAGFPTDPSTFGGAWSNTTDQTEWIEEDGAVEISAATDTPLAFNATESKKIGGAAETMVFESTIKFTPFETMPEDVPADAKAAVILVKDGEAYKIAYKRTVSGAASWITWDGATFGKDDEIAVKVEVTGDATKSVAQYFINGTAITGDTCESTGAFSAANFTGDGEIKSLSATYNEKKVTFSVPSADGATAVVYTNNVALAEADEYTLVNDTPIKVVYTAEDGKLFNNGLNTYTWNGNAAETIDTKVDDQGLKDAPAAIGSTYYYTVQAAFNAATADQVVQLRTTVDEAVTYTGDADITFDLNGNTLRDETADATLINNGTGTITIKDGLMTDYGAIISGQKGEGASGIAVYARTGAITIKSGLFENNSDSVAAVVAKDGAIVIEGGKFTNYGGDNIALAKENGGAGSISVSGGSFTSDPTDFLKSDDYKAELDEDTGYYNVTFANPEAEIGGVFYLTFADAFKAAKDGDTIEIICPESGNPITVNGLNIVANQFPTKGLTIELAGSTLEFAKDSKDGTTADAIAINTNNVVTFQNGMIQAADGTDFRDMIRFYGHASNSTLTIDNINFYNDYLTAGVTDKAHSVVTIEGGNCTIKSGSIAVPDEYDANTFYAIKFGNHANETQYSVGTLTLCGTGELLFQQCKINGDILLTGGTYVEGDYVDVKGKYYYGKNAWSCWEDNSTVFAARTGVLPAKGAEDNFCGQLYKTLSAAVTDLAANDTLTLLKDASATDVAALDKAITLDLNGKTFAVADGDTFTAGAALTVVNGVAGQGGLDISGKFVANANVNLRALAYGEGGLLKQKGGSLDIASAATVNFMAAWDGNTANQLKAYTSGFFGTLGTGAKVVTDKSYTWNGTMFDVEGAVANAETATGLDSFDSLAAAIEKVTANGTVTLVQDVTLASTLTIGKVFTFDLGAKTVSLAADGDGIQVTANATIQNGSLVSTRTVNSPDSPGAGVDAIRTIRTSATLKNLTIDAAHYRMGVATDCGNISSEAELYDTAPDFTVACENVDVTGNGVLFYGEYANLTLDANCSGKLVGDPFTYQTAIYSTGNARITIAGGEYENTLAILIGNYGAKVTVNGGDFKGDIKSWMQTAAHTDLQHYDDFKATFTLNAGTYNGATILFADDTARSLDVFTKGKDVAIVAPASFGWDYGTTLAKMLKYYATVYANGEPYTWAGLGTGDAFYAKGVEVDALTAGVTNIGGQVYYVSKLLRKGTPDDIVCEFEFDGTTLTKKVGATLDVTVNADNSLSYKVTTGDPYTLDSLGHACIGGVYYTKYEQSGPTPGAGSETKVDQVPGVENTYIVSPTADNESGVVVVDGVKSGDTLVVSNASVNTIGVNDASGVTVKIFTPNAKAPASPYDITAACKGFGTGEKANKFDATLNPDAVVKVGEEEIPVTPTSAVSAEGTVAEGAVATKAIPGLTYTLKRGSTLGSYPDQADQKMAETTTVSLKDATGTKPAAQAFYVIEVTK